MQHKAVLILAVLLCGIQTESKIVDLTRLLQHVHVTNRDGSEIQINSDYLVRFNPSITAINLPGTSDVYLLKYRVTSPFVNMPSRFTTMQKFVGFFLESPYRHEYRFEVDDLKQFEEWELFFNERDIRGVRTQTNNNIGYPACKNVVRRRRRVLFDSVHRGMDVDVLHPAYYATFPRWEWKSVKFDGACFALVRENANGSFSVLSNLCRSSYPHLHGWIRDNPTPTHIQGDARVVWLPSTPHPRPPPDMTTISFVVTSDCVMCTAMQAFALFISLNTTDWSMTSPGTNLLYGQRHPTLCSNNWRQISRGAPYGRNWVLFEPGRRVNPLMQMRFLFHLLPTWIVEQTARVDECLIRTPQLNPGVHPFYRFGLDYKFSLGLLLFVGRNTNGSESVIRGLNGTRILQFYTNR